MSDNLWVNGVCDNILLTLRNWAVVYEKGRVSATGRYMTKPGEMGPQPKEIDVPTRRAVKVAWREHELKKLTDVLDTKIPHTHESYSLVRDLKTNLPRWKNGQLIPGGARIIEMDWYFAHVMQVYRLFEAMKYGKAEEERIDLSTIDLSSFSKEDTGSRS